MAADAKSEPVADASAVGSKASPPPSASASPKHEGHWVEERPEAGLARGKYAFPDWGVALVGGLVVTLGVAYLATRYHRFRKR
jgi:hypothetical protein